ncbi:MAG: Npt1/Npt2 family nucleotide transporter [Candidatus Eisenbacteria bacterium]
MEATGSPDTRTADKGRLGPLDRVLNIFSDVRGGEGLTAILLLLNVFMLLAAYYLIKTIREPLVLAAEGGGAEVKSYASAAIAGLLIVLVPLYSAIASRVSRVKLINGVTLFFIACLVAFFLWARVVGVPGTMPDEDAAAAGAVAAVGGGQLALGISFFIWVGIFNLMIIAQFWAFANDIYTVEQGKRLFAIIAVGASLGAIAGSWSAEKLIEQMGLYPLMGIAAGILALCIVLTNVVHARERGHARARASEPQVPAEGEGGGDADAVIKGRSGFALVFADKYLLLIALLMLILNLVNSTGEYILGETLTNIAKERVAAGQLAADDIGKWIGTFYGDYFFWVNTVSAIVQMFLVSRIIKWIGVRGALLILPVVALGAYAILVAAPVLAFIRGAKIAENSLDYSLNNTTRQTLFLPTSREAKYKGKQAIDTFFVRVGDVLSAGLVFAGTTWLAFAPKQFAMVNVALVLIWLGIAFMLGRMFKERAKGEA